ncbi:MAG: hypothetical protein GKS00_09230 [Alphaproteobacteria bacterium]|nr:hypothetical protein [Alphaproteobacteria bacterium]
MNSWLMKYFVCGLLLQLIGGSALAAEERPKGPVLLTIAGAIERVNRGPYDAFEDGLMKAHDFSFSRAFEFDNEMLEGLGMQTLLVRYPDWPRAYRFEGPLLRDVLKAVGASGKAISAVALDGYSAEISMQDIHDYPILLAIKKDGRYLGIGGRGPAWIVFPRETHKALADRDESQWVWSAYLILAE